ncbi:aryl-alcohol dehydrogenase-like predicted oxidoreductase [Amycolatopsis lexingtonensis]|uniref:Aryl-alcohol dehydrogenase-like predicted oxidoreductase n=1 Tax=Amycolatopsis lexingtonensis TaxID=218822 RepID=A0ABR9ICP8_9PSEU|nr:oxidoreductase [Amycolatopsis lexingtonensis]MBE1500959.1 aryl-alcohol dehydrogenase-like predicted oxidoreductase [Amycolatopsis lexingtonensis]
MANLGGTYPLGGEFTVTRMGYGAMQLAGPGVWGPPKDHDTAVAVLREAVDSGVTHLDTSDYYGPHTVNALIKEALHPYPENLCIVTKVGARRSEDKAWPAALSPEELTQAVHDNLRNLGVDALDVVNLRLSNAAGDYPVAMSLAEPFGVLAELREQGLIRQLGVSHVTAEQLDEAKAIAPVVCVQNQYNLAHRENDPLVDKCAAEGTAFVPYFPLGGFSPLQSGLLDDCAARVGATPMQVALAWLLQRSPSMLLIPGTSSPEHLRENLAAAELELPGDVLADLDRIGAP